MEGPIAPAVFQDITGMGPPVLPAPPFRPTARRVLLGLHAGPAPPGILEPSAILASQAIISIMVLALFARRSARIVWPALAPASVPLVRRDPAGLLV